MPNRPGTYKNRRSYAANTWVLTNRHILWRVLRGFIRAGQPRLTPDRLASFELWDDLVRQCVLWLARENIAALGDPAASIASAKSSARLMAD